MFTCNKGLTVNQNQCFCSNPSAKTLAKDTVIRYSGVRDHIKTIII